MTTIQWWIFQFRGRRQELSKIDVVWERKSFDLGLHIFLRNSWCPLKKKGLHFDFVSDFSIFLSKSGCSLKKKVFTQNRSLHSKETFAVDWNCMCYFWGGFLKSRGLPKKGRPEETASFASPNIHHCYDTIAKFFIRLLQCCNAAMLSSV